MDQHRHWHARGRRGGMLFWLFGIDFSLAELKVTLEDLLAAFVGSLLCTAAR